MNKPEITGWADSLPKGPGGAGRPSMWDGCLEEVRRSGETDKWAIIERPDGKAVGQITHLVKRYPELQLKTRGSQLWVRLRTAEEMAERQAAERG